MKPTEIRELIANATLAELDQVWRDLSTGIKVGSGAYAYRYDRQHASRAMRWLPHAIQSAEAASASLSTVARLNPEESGARARAAFLEVVHGVTSPTTLPTNIRKAANNVSESVRRAIKFLQAMLPEDGLPEDSLWPPPVRSPRLDRGVRLYRDFRTAHLRAGILDPAQHSPSITDRVAQEHAERCRKAGSYGPYNRMVRDLREMLRDGSLAGVPASLADGLGELRLNPTVGPARTMPITELARRWPDHFRMADGRSLDETYGLLGYYNRELGVRRPPGLDGTSCPPDNLLGRRALRSRLECLRRYLARVASPSDSDLRDCFSAARVWDWLRAYIEERDQVSSMHLHAWLAVRYTAVLYLGLPMSEVDKQVAEGIEFPSSISSLKGTSTLQLVGDDPVAALRTHAAALRRAAESSPKLSSNRRSGKYLPRKSAEVEFWLRLLTGLRPSNVEELVFLDAPRLETTEPAIWREKDGFTVCVPFRSLKQNKRRSKGTPTVPRKPRTERPLVFIIEYRPAVDALNEYLAEGWSNAKAVHEGRSRRLLLNAQGEPFRSFETSQRKTRKRAIRMDVTGDTHADLDRYSTRHIMAELLRRYMPGGRLQTLYLTHKSERNADQHYGNDDMSFLRKCIHEILDGLPPLPEQERMRAARVEEMERERDKAIADMARRVEATGNDLATLAAALAAKEAEVQRLRGRLAEERAVKSLRQRRSEQ